MNEQEIYQKAWEVVQDYLRDVRDNGPDNIAGFVDIALMGYEPSPEEAIKVDKMAILLLRNIIERAIKAEALKIP